LHKNGFIRLAPKTHDIGLADSHIPNIERLYDDFNTAVNAIWPRRHHTPYQSVHVLLLSWVEDDLGILFEIKRLKHVFREWFNYQVETYQIPSIKPDTALKRCILEFLGIFDAKDALLIVYYAGHGSPSQNPGASALWYA
jgi:hypothetical protein